MAVKFLVAHTVGSLYNPGDVAGFDDVTEADLTDRGIAENHTAKGKGTDPEPMKVKKVGEGWSVFAGRKEVVKGLADENVAKAWIIEQNVRPQVPEARQVGETWSVFAGTGVLVDGLADEAAANTWIAERTAG